jgi:hypothetical protein
MERIVVIYSALQETISNLQLLSKDDISELSQEELDALEYLIIFVDDIS